MDLNGELARLASAVSEYFVVGSDIDSDGSDNVSVVTTSSPRLPNDKSGQEIHDRLKEALGSTFYHLIFTSPDPPSDPSLFVQYAVQAWLVWCCSRILDGFCFGLPGETERLLTDVWESMKREGLSHFSIFVSPPPDFCPETLTFAFFAWDATELQPMSSRWRGLTHEYLRGVLTASIPKSCQLPTPPDSPSISALYRSQSSEPLSVRALRGRELFELNVRGILNILSGVGLEVDHAPLPPCTRRSPTSRGDLFTVFDGKVINATKVVDEFGEALKRIQEQTIELARVTREGVMSGWFDITRVPGAVTLSTLAPTPSPPPPSQQNWAPLSVSTPQKGGRRATVGTPPRRSDNAAGDRRMSEPSLTLPLSLPQTPPRNHDRTATYSPNPDRTPTHTPSINRSPNLDRPHPSPSSPSRASHPQTSTHPSLTKPRDARVLVTKFDHRKMENVFQGFGREDRDCVVMCTVEFGLDWMRKVVSDEDLGVMFSPIEPPIGLPASRVPEKGVSDVEMMEKRTLVKPKVLLENVVEIVR
jgi:hypothetical protein